MDNLAKGTQITSVFKYVQQVFTECQRLFFKIDNLMAPDWKTIYGNRITKDVTASLQDPERWLVEAIFRVYEGQDKLVNKAITISFWGEDIDEPIITAGKLVYSDISKRDHWDLWNVWFAWSDDNEKNEYKVNGSIYDFGSKERSYITEAKAFSYPLVSIANDTELEAKIVNPLKSL